MNLPMIAVIVGLVVGTIAVLCACLVWVRHREFGLGGGVLVGFGVILILISVISEVRFEVTATGPKIEILRQQLARTAEAVEQIATETRQLAGTLQTSEQNIRHLTDAMRRSPSLPDDVRLRLRDSVRLPPASQPGSLDAALTNLGAVQKALTAMPRRDP